MANHRLSLSYMFTAVVCSFDNATKVFTTHRFSVYFPHDISKTDAAIITKL